MTSNGTLSPARRPAGSRPAPPELQPRWHRLARALVALVVLVLLATIGWSVGFSSLFAARHVAVSGARTLTAEEVRAAAAVPLGVPLARQDVDAIATRVAGLQLVRSVQVSRSWPRTVSVHVQERTALLAVRQPDGFVLIDDQGQAYLTVADVPREVVLAQVDPGNAGLLRNVGVVAAALPPSVRHAMTSISAYTADGIELKLTGGKAVVWGSADQSALKAQVLVALLSRPAKSYDVSAPHSPALR